MLPINCPYMAKVRTQQRDGPMCIFGGGADTNYFTGLPASGGAQLVDPRAAESKLAVTGFTGRYDPTPADPADDYVQPGALGGWRRCGWGGTGAAMRRRTLSPTPRRAGDLYRKVMTEAQRGRLVANIAGHLKGARKDIRDRMLVHFARVDKDMCRAIAAGVEAALAPATVAAAAAAAAAAVVTVGRT